MKIKVFIAIASLACMGAGRNASSVNGAQEKVSFSDQVFPIIKKNCLPCHAEENSNPSELSLDSYENLMLGGKHGPPVIPGNSKESLLLKKLVMPPPFGDRMPPNRKNGGAERKALTEEEMNIISQWIDRGAKEHE